ncbi:MAG: HAMP domain-containing histidine kinase, partial [Gemmatimonadota bacterium]|nr:HAMP domain-containing histidine kinase [Gemmatimonadota bacterium]
AGESLGAHSGAVADLHRGVCRAVWRCRQEDVDPLVRPEGPLEGALDRDTAWPDFPVLYTPAAASGEGGLLVAPLRIRELLHGALLLFFRGGWPPPDAVRELAAAYAGLLALTHENHALFEEARRAQQSRDHFLTALHHELRTPATALMLEAGILQEGVFGAVPDRLAQSLARVETHASELIQVVGRVLDLAWVEAGEPPTTDDLLDPRQRVLELLRAVEPTANRKGLRLAVFLPRSLPRLHSDAERFSRIVLHLLSNAIKYTDDGGIQVRLERRTSHAPPRRRETQLVLRVIDSGRGIPPEQIERVFEPFAQVEEGARSDSGTRGVGLGLPIARQLARSLGGDVMIESGVGKGTTATLVLPYGTAA